MLSQLQAKGVRPYFYYIDIHGQVFLQDTYPKNFTSCFKDPKFLDFFMARIKRNTTEVFPEYTWQSPCGKEINFVEAADTPIVFHGLRDGHLVWAGTLRTPFLPDQLSVSESTGRIYHPLPPSSQGLARLQSAPDKSKHRGCALGLLKSSLVLAELAASLDQDSLIWHGQHYDLTRLP
ncbi:hypothetical protein BGZ99_007397 [Dissophora globulifera]|uniref:Uncharacterized protein n=1 Tax=Dissophora globulifera TaxID=979702 RepID=A0A9P6RRT4_9FUNG|nr:hypothetical protein BGZ99_007397 [Dissophora globulifera]